MNTKDVKELLSQMVAAERKEILVPQFNHVKPLVSPLPFYAGLKGWHEHKKGRERKCKRAKTQTVPVGQSPPK